MGSTERGDESPEGNRARRIYAVLSDARCRTVLSTLDRDGPMQQARLAAAVVADERGVSVEAVPDSDAERVLCELYHLHLPKLDRAGLIAWEDETVRPRLSEPRPVVPDAQAFLEADRTRAARCLRLLAVDERRAALTVLSRMDGPVALSTLVTAVQHAGGVDTSGHDPDALRLAFHHLHLPKLDRAGLLRYDDERKRVEPVAAGAVVDDAV